ncbi:retrovirus-related pol polyprotein from transposon TNT 1-94 [Tanacetum coccineum]
MEAAVDQCSVDKNTFEIQIKQLSIDNDQLLKQIMSQEISVENSDLNAQLQEKVFAIAALKNELRKLKGKNIVDTAISKPSATIAPGMFKLDIEPISHRLKNNRDAHEELLVYVSQTCPNSPKPSEKLVAVTPLNKDKRVRFAEPVTSSSNIPKQTDSLKIKDFNKPLLTSTGVKPTTSASGSKPSGNTKNKMITQPPSSNQKNKVEDHSRKVKSSLNKMNSLTEPVSNALVKHSVRNAKFESICAICNKCLFDANHDMFIIDYVNDVNYQKDHLCSACALGKSKKHSHKPKVEDSIQEKLYLLHMDLCGPMRIQSINERKYILVIVDDYSRFTWVKFLRSKDEVLEFVIKFLKMIQVRLNATVRNIRTDNGNEFVNHTLKAYYEEVEISHQTSVARTLQQNGVVERRNHTLVEAARTMLIFSKALLFLLAEAVATTCYTQNRSLIRKGHNKTPYELLHDRKPDLSYLHVFGSLCYPTNDGEDLGKLKPKADIGIFCWLRSCEESILNLQQKDPNDY